MHFTLLTPVQYHHISAKEKENYKNVEASSLPSSIYSEKDLLILFIYFGTKEQS